MLFIKNDPMYNNSTRPSYGVKCMFHKREIIFVTLYYIIFIIIMYTNINLVRTCSKTARNKIFERIPVANRPVGKPSVGKIKIKIK